MSMAFGGEESAGRWFARQPGWWESHYGDAVSHILDFLEGDGVSLQGLTVMDIGCGDGTISLGLAARSGAGRVLGTDVVDVDMAFLADLANQHGVSVPSNLSFEKAPPGVLPGADGSIDFAMTWSVLEHVVDLEGLLSEVRRVLRLNGLFFAQVWPLFYSEHGSHLWNWMEPFSHLTMDRENLLARIRERAGEVAPAMIDLYNSCNRVTVDEVADVLHSVGFYLAKVELSTHGFHVPAQLQGTSISRLGIDGFKLLAVRQ